MFTVDSKTIDRFIASIDGTSVIDVLDVASEFDRNYEMMNLDNFEFLRYFGTGHVRVSGSDLEILLSDGTWSKLCLDFTYLLDSINNLIPLDQAMSADQLVTAWNKFASGENAFISNYWNSYISSIQNFSFISEITSLIQSSDDEVYVQNKVRDWIDGSPTQFADDLYNNVIGSSDSNFFANIAQWISEKIHPSVETKFDTITEMDGTIRANAQVSLNFLAVVSFQLTDTVLPSIGQWIVSAYSLTYKIRCAVFRGLSSIIGFVFDAAARLFNAPVTTKSNRNQYDAYMRQAMYYPWSTLESQLNAVKSAFSNQNEFIYSSFKKRVLNEGIVIKGSGSVFLLHGDASNLYINQHTLFSNFKLWNNSVVTGSTYTAVRNINEALAVAFTLGSPASSETSPLRVIEAVTNYNQLYGLSVSCSEDVNRIIMLGYSTTQGYSGAVTALNTENVQYNKNVANPLSTMMLELSWDDASSQFCHLSLDDVPSSITGLTVAEKEALYHSRYFNGHNSGGTGELDELKAKALAHPWAITATEDTTSSRIICSNYFALGLVCLACAPGDFILNASGLARASNFTEPYNKLQSNFKLMKYSYFNRKFVPGYLNGYTEVSSYYSTVAAGLAATAVVVTVLAYTASNGGFKAVSSFIKTNWSNFRNFQNRYLLKQANSGIVDVKEAVDGLTTSMTKGILL